MSRSAAAQALLFLLGSAPFCMPLAGLRGVLYGEMLVAVAAIGMVCLAREVPLGRRSFPVALWVLGLALIWTINGSVKNPFLSLVLWPSLAMLTVAAMLLSLQSLVSDEKERIVLWLALLKGVWLGSVINALMMLLQLGISIVDDNNLEIRGLLGQRNLLAEYICLGLVASAVLHIHGVLPRVVWGFASALQVFLLPLTTSRSAIGYLILLLIAGLWFAWRRSRVDRGLGFGLFLVGGLGLLCQILTPIVVGNVAEAMDAPTSVAAYGSHSGVTRLLSGGRGYALESQVAEVDQRFSPHRRLRLAEGRKALQIAQEHPWFGVGSAMYGRWSAEMQLRPEYIGIPAHGHYEHAHNLILQMLAEQGLVGGGVLLVGLAILLFRARNAAPMVLPGGYLILGIILIHSMIDFPLWHLQFFAVFCVVLAFMQPCPDVGGTRLSSWWKYPVALLLIWGLVTAWSSYRLLAGNAKSNFIHSVSRAQVAAVSDFRTHPLLDYYASQILIARSEPDVRVEGMGGLLERFNRGAAQPYPLIKEAILLVQAGRIPEAKERIKLAAAAFPFAIRDMPASLAELQPDERAPLIETLYLVEAEVLAGFASRGLSKDEFGYQTLPPREKLEFPEPKRLPSFGRVAKP